MNHITTARGANHSPRRELRDRHHLHAGGRCRGGLLAKKTVTAKSYTPFGEQIGETTSGFGYNGEYYNAATGMIYLRARFYAPEMNRFGQKDLLRGSIADPVSLNRYLYCQSDPVNFADYNGLQMVNVCVADGGGGGGKKTTTSSSGSTTPRVYTNTSQPKVYSNSYQEYQDQRRNAVTPNPQEYAMLRQTGYSGSFSQYASNKTHTQFPSYPEYMQGRAMGNPYYVTYNNGKPTPVAYQRTYYTNNQSKNATGSISRDAPEVYDVTDGQYSCGRDIHALGAGDYGAEQAGELWSRIPWKRIASALFGVESRTTHQTGSSKTFFDQIITDKTTAEWFNYLFPLNFEFGAGISYVLSSSGDSTKPISVFSEQRVDDFTQSSVGLALNTTWLSAEQSLGLSNTGLSIIGHFNDTDLSAGLNIDLTKVHVELEAVVSTDAGDGSQKYSYYNVSVNPIVALLIYEFVQTGNPAVFQPSY